MSAQESAPLPNAAELDELAREERAVLRLHWALPDWVRANPALGFTAVYLFASATGSVFHFLFFRQFGLNVLEFSAPADFAMVVIREPVTVALALAGLPLFVAYGDVYHRFLRWRRARFPRPLPAPEKRRLALERSRRYGPVLQVLFIGIYAVNFLLFYAFWRGRQIRDGDFRPVTVVCKNDAPRADGTFRHERVALLGTTSGFVFLFDPVRRTAEAAPFDAVSHLEWDARPRREREADPVRPRLPKP